MDETKKWYESAGVIGGIVAALSGAAGLFGYAITPADQAVLTTSVSQVLQLGAAVTTIVGGAIAVWGRVRASKTIAK